MLPAQSAGGSASTTNLGTIPFVGGTNNRLNRVTITPAGASAANDTNYVTVEIGRTRAGTRTVVATVSTTVAGGGLASNTPKAIPVTQTDPSSNAPGDLFDCKLTQVASGVAVVVGAVVEVEID